MHLEQLRFIWNNMKSREKNIVTIKISQIMVIDSFEHLVKITLAFLWFIANCLCNFRKTVVFLIISMYKML